MESNTAIVVQYNGKRFPRTVGLRGGKKINFTAERTMLELDEYDALLLLKLNTRLTPQTFQFTVVDVVKNEQEEVEQAPVEKVKKPKGLKIKKQGGSNGS